MVDPPPGTSPVEQRLSRDDLLSDDFVLFIVRFGLRLTASRWGTSERTLRRLFHSMDTTPRTIVRDVRLREARRLLATEQPLPDVARHLGESPTVLRRALRRPA